MTSREASVPVFPEHGRDKSEAFVCSECGVPLRESKECLDCPRCGRSTPIVNGVPHFIKTFPYWGEIPLDDMREVNRLAQTGCWKRALLDSEKSSVQRAAEMILNLERANWQWLLDLPSESRVLDVGAGTGTNSHALALHYREIVALEPVLERIHFMQERFAQENLSNIKIVRTSLWTLPFAPESFDLIAMNGVLEWVPQGQPGDPGEVQQRSLKKMLGLLRPGGTLYLGIENRICPEYFVGYLDPHCRLPFVTVLPRPLANWYAKRKGHRDGYRNYLYSSRGYRKLLQKVGFTKVEMYLALPSYNHPKVLIPLEGNVFLYFSRNFNQVRGSRLWQIAYEVLLWMGLLKYMEDSFVILAHK